MIDDSELLRRFAQDGQEAPFRELVDRHVAKVYAVCLRRSHGNAHLAEEATQQVFTTLSRKAHSLRGHTSLAGWLFVSARYSAGALVRAEQRHGRLRDRIMNEPREGDTRFDWEALRPEIDEAIGSLGDRDREAVLLRFFDGRTFGDIGRALAISEDGARLRVERALEKLRVTLRRRGISSTAAALAGVLGTQSAVAITPGFAAAIASNAILAAPGAAAGLLFLTAMTTTSKVGLTALVLGLLATGYGVRSEFKSIEGERDDATSALARARLRNAALETKLADLERRNRGNQRPGTGLASAGKSDSPGVVVVHFSQILRDHPEFASIIARRTRHEVAAQYDKAIASLHLPADIATQLKTLLIDREQASRDAMAAANLQGSGDTDLARQATQQAQDAVTPQIKALIGDQLFSQLEASSANTGQRSYRTTQADGYAVDMEDAGAPLTPDQTALLEQAVYSTFAPEANPKTASAAYRAGDPTTQLSQMDSDLVASLGSNLSPRQIEVLKQSLEDENETSYLVSLYNPKKSPSVISMDN